MGVGTGGYGALMAAQNAPDAFVGAAAVNPVLDVACLYGTDYEPQAGVSFGEKEALAAPRAIRCPRRFRFRFGCTATQITRRKRSSGRRTARKSQWKMSARRIFWKSPFRSTWKEGSGDDTHAVSYSIEGIADGDGRVGASA